MGEIYRWGALQPLPPNWKRRVASVARGGCRASVAKESALDGRLYTGAFWFAG